MNFVFSPLLWGLLAVAAPVLIHLINMMRHRRVQWAAMEFLLQSQKRNRTWVMLKQLLLLLLRMAAIAAVVFLVAQPLFKESLGSLFGGRRTHHIILLDDSFSMSDTSGGPSAFEQGVKVTGQLGQHVIKLSQDSTQNFSLLRFSQANRKEGASKYDISHQLVNGEFPKILEDKTRLCKVSELASGPVDALETVRNMVNSEDEQRIVYIVTDFRSKEWDNPAEIKKLLTELGDSKVEFHFVQCVEAQHDNLAITGLEPEPATRAAGVAMFMQIAVKNFGATTQQQVAISLDEDGKTRPGVKIEKIEPGKTAVERFQVFFQEPGVHRIRAYLPSADAIAVDNQRFASVEIPATVPVLLIDGDPKAARTRGDSFYLASALTPGGQVNTGLRPRVETARYLASHTLDEFAAVYVLNLERMDASEVAVLEEYVKKGGGVAFYLGPLCSAKFFNDNLYREGKGLFPLPLAGAVDLLVDRNENAPDMTLSPHPIFKHLLGSPSNDTPSVRIDKYFAAQKDWTPSADSAVKMLIRTRNGAPLMVEQKYGEGRVLAVLTTAAPTWHNWTKQGSFILTTLELQAYLSTRPEIVRLVGTPLSLQLDRTKYKPPFHLLQPNQGQPIILTYPDDEDAKKKPFEVQITADQTGTSGLYDLSLPRIDLPTEQTEARHLAFNVATEESDLRYVKEDGLRNQLKGVAFSYHLAEQLHYDSSSLAGVNLSKTWEYLLLLILLLLGEQVLAYSASYHTARAAAKGMVPA